MNGQPQRGEQFPASRRTRGQYKRLQGGKNAKPRSVSPVRRAWSNCNATSLPKRHIQNRKSYNALGLHSTGQIGLALQQLGGDVFGIHFVFA